ncbi:hypothetical protein BJ508DRAFT_365856 [Ascobolus immersus RN42]|uniref:F-box domain-containing protein n=1 Tax=Ascobolus immersus RN42 TaxID=1160509 RepID=A0A3N4HZQ3_ASCIM|nr:hypothetical protein BJ508DRAFT_365856 [Ascobolus immersus RN42]
MARCVGTFGRLPSARTRRKAEPPPTPPPPTPPPPKTTKKPNDPALSFPVEIFILIFRYMPDLKGVVGLERVSRGWAEVVRSVCTPSWVRVEWDWGTVDWRGETRLGKDSGMSEWEKFKDRVKSVHDMRLGFASEVFEAPKSTPFVVQDRYTAWLYCGKLYGHANPDTLVIRSRVADKERKPGAKRFEQMCITTSEIVMLCGVREPAKGKGERIAMTIFSVGPDGILLLMVGGYSKSTSRHTIFAYISTETCSLVWARSPTMDNWYYPPEKRNNEPGSIAKQRGDGSCPFGRGCHDLTSPATTPFITFMTSRSISHQSIVIKEPIKIWTLDVSTGTLVDSLTHEVPDIVKAEVGGNGASSAWYYESSFIPAIAVIDIPHAPAPSDASSHPARYKLILSSTTSNPSCNASLHDSISKTTITTITLALTNEIHKLFPSDLQEGSQVMASLRLPKEGVRLTCHSLTATKHLVFATISYHGGYRESSKHLSWTFAVEFTRPGIAPTLTLEETNIYQPTSHTNVAFNPRTRLGSFRRSGNNVYKIPSAIVMVPYREDDEKGKEDGLRWWSVSAKEAREVMMPAVKAKKELGEVERRSRWSRINLRSWEDVEREERKVLGGDLGGVRVVGEGFVVGERGIVWF